MSEYETPSLPEGYYFHVTNISRYNGWVQVRLMRKRKLRFDKIVRTDDCFATKAHIKYSMDSLLDALYIHFKTKELIGYYPPKKL